MTIDRIFFGFMAVVGIATGMALVAKPQIGDYFIKPYFWILIAVALFDIANYLRAKGQPGVTTGMEARLLGFVIGVVLMVVIPSLAGSPAKFF